MSLFLRGLFFNLTSAGNAQDLETAYRFGSQFTEKMAPQQATDYEQAAQRHRQAFAACADDTASTTKEE